MISNFFNGYDKLDNNINLNRAKSIKDLSEGYRK